MFSISDWCRVHRFCIQNVSDIIAASNSGALSPALFSKQNAIANTSLASPHGSLTCNLQTFIVPALSELFSVAIRCDTLVAQIEFADGSSGHPPYTEDLGAGHAPVISMNWSGSADDLICLAHEVAHALQIQLSDHSLMPPVARETCAFLGELALLNYCRRHAPDLFERLLEVWHLENGRYLGCDLDALANALHDPETPYQYRLNYPLARLSAIELFQPGGGCVFDDLFSSGALGMQHLPIEDMTSRAENRPNYLPPMPEAHASMPVVDAYRSLGAMALLDIDDCQVEAKQRIEDYYNRLLKHLQDRSAFVALNRGRKPIGYAIWTRSQGAKSITIEHQTTPFGDDHFLLQSLERHLGQSVGLISRDARRTQPHQVA